MATSAPSRKSSKKNERHPVDRPFAPDVLSRARAIVSRYGLVVRFDLDAGEYSASVIELPLVVGYEKTPEKSAREAVALATTAVAYMIEQGHVPPPPGTESPRTEQVNFRVSPEEKARMDAAAQRQGLTLVDYVRGSALRSPRTTDNP